jgi:aminoglycoside phosphotransferase
MQHVHRRKKEESPVEDRTTEEKGEEVEDPFHGRELYNYFGNRVIESKTTSGDIVAVKVKPRAIEKAIRRESRMIKHVSEQPHLQVPHYRGCYRVGKHHIVIVTDLLQGTSLDKVWHKMNKKQQNSIKQQLKEQMQLFQTCTQPYIGSIGHRETSNFYERLGLGFESMGPWDSEEEFDNWCLERVRSSFCRSLWKRLLPKMRGSSSGPGNFVLTHGDLAARNIMVDMDQCKLTGIVDWENSGFFPKYVEYASAMVISDGHEDWWKPVLKEILEPCGWLRLKFQAQVKYRGW